MQRWYASWHVKDVWPAAWRGLAGVACTDNQGNTILFGTAHPKDFPCSCDRRGFAAQFQRQRPLGLGLGLEAPPPRPEGGSRLVDEPGVRPLRFGEQARLVPLPRRSDAPAAVLGRARWRARRRTRFVSSPMFCLVCARVWCRPGRPPEAVRPLGAVAPEGALELRNDRLTLTHELREARLPVTGTPQSVAVVNASSPDVTAAEHSPRQLVEFRCHQSVAGPGRARSGMAMGGRLRPSVLFNASRRGGRGSPRFVWQRSMFRLCV